MRGMLSSGLILLLGSVLTHAEDAGQESSPLHDSRLLSPPPQAAIALPQDGLADRMQNADARDAYTLLDDDRGFERLLDAGTSTDSGQPYAHLLDDELLQRIKQLVQQEQKRLAWNRKPYAPMFVGKKAAPLFIGKKSAPYFVGRRAAPYFVGKRDVPYFVGKRAAPYFVGKKSAPYFVGKKAAPYFVGKKAAPYFVGKKAAPYFVGKKSAPYFVGKRAAPYFVGKKSAPYFVGKRAVPYFVGKKSVPMFVGKKSAPMFIGKKSAPMFVGKRRFADILDIMANSPVQDRAVSLFDSRGEMSHVSPIVKRSDRFALYTHNEFQKQYPALYLISKRYHSSPHSYQSHQPDVKVFSPSSASLASALIQRNVDLHNIEGLPVETGNGRWDFQDPRTPSADPLAFSFLGKPEGEHLSKRYAEFIGKRSNDKRYFEFPGKRDVQMSELLRQHMDKRLSVLLGRRLRNRIPEFIGKRSRTGPSGFYEFIGK